MTGVDSHLIDYNRTVVATSSIKPRGHWIEIKVLLVLHEFKDSLVAYSGATRKSCVNLKIAWWTSHTKMHIYPV
jgi:hypothetical protein